jgi:hypothetical protein
VIGNRSLTIFRATEDGRDAEGRRAAGAWEPVMVVVGNLFSTQVNVVGDDGQLLTVWDYKALVPPTADIRTQDRIVSDGTSYRVQSVTARRGPDGSVHHLSVTCERED